MVGGGVLATERFSSKGRQQQRFTAAAALTECNTEGRMQQRFTAVAALAREDVSWDAHLMATSPKL